MFIYTRTHRRVLENVKAQIKQGFESTIDSIFPPRCALCQEPGDQGFCPNCQKLLPWIDKACLICSGHLENNGICGSCQKHKPSYTHSIVPFRYDAPISHIIQQLKYADQLHCAFALGKMLSSRIMRHKSRFPDVIIPIPLHRKRIKTRGFNQAIEIAKVVSKNTGIPLQKQYLIRSKNTDSQTGLSEKARYQNMRNAFTVNTTAHYKHVAILDDVVTSGATINSAASTLIKSGVETVSVWAIAKT